MNQQVEHDLGVIQSRLLADYQGVEGIILVGGFGRGEGGLVWQDGKFTPENDYDLELLTAQPVNVEKLIQTEKDLAQALGVKWVHIENRLIGNLGQLPYTQYVYDMKYGGRVLHGPKDLLDSIPDMRNAQMPLAEGEKLLHTRLWCFLGPYTTDFKKRNPNQEEAVFLVSQISKALFAICDAHLMLKRNYQVQYQNKSKYFLDTGEADEELKKWVRWATEYKLHPSDAEIPPPLDLYRTVRTYFLDTLFEYAQTSRKTTFKSWIDYGDSFQDWVTPNPRATRIKQLIKILLRRVGPPGRYQDMVRLKMYMVLAGACPDHPEYIEQIQSILKRQNAQIEKASDWETLRKHTLNLLGI